MLIKQTGRQRRRGADVVEMLFVALILLMFLFGLFEYCRLLFMMNIVANAARDTARFAAALSRPSCLGCRRGQALR